MLLYFNEGNVTDVKLNIEDTYGANPAPLGLFGFAMTTILLNIHNAGFFPLDTMIYAMGIFYGGIAQVIAGKMEFKKGNTFGTVAFTSYGLFWITLVALWMLPKMGLGAAPNKTSMGCYLAMWGIFTTGMFIGTLKANTISKLVFGSLSILFFLLAAANFADSHTIHTIAGYEGILCGLFAFYDGLAQILNEKFGRTVLSV